MFGLDAHVGTGTDSAAREGVDDPVELGIVRSFRTLRPLLVIREVVEGSLEQIRPACAARVFTLCFEDIARMTGRIQRLDATVSSVQWHVRRKRRRLPSRQLETDRLPEFVEALRFILFHARDSRTGTGPNEGTLRRGEREKLASTNRIRRMRR